jgi:hypothetical protein
MQSGMQWIKDLCNFHLTLRHHRLAFFMRVIEERIMTHLELKFTLCSNITYFTGIARVFSTGVTGFATWRLEQPRDARQRRFRWSLLGRFPKRHKALVRSR